MAKTANLLIDGLGSPSTVGLLVPLHWQTVSLLLAGVATGATVVLAAEPEGLAGCDAAFVLAEHAGAALDAGVEEVLALSGHPLGAASGTLPAMAQDYAREVPAYADHFGGPRPGPARVLVGDMPPPSLVGVGPDDRVLTALDPSDPAGAAVLLAALAAGAGLVLLRAGDAQAVSRAERVTLTAGRSVPELTRLA